MFSCSSRDSHQCATEVQSYNNGQPSPHDSLHGLPSGQGSHACSTHIAFLRNVGMYRPKGLHHTLSHRNKIVTVSSCYLLRLTYLKYRMRFVLERGDTAVTGANYTLNGVHCMVPSHTVPPTPHYIW